MRPVLLLGGSGGKTLHVICQTLLRKLKQVEWTVDGLSEARQMIWIDSVSAPLPDGEDFCGLVSPVAGHRDRLEGVNAASQGPRACTE
jgi:hypothetical protein